MALFDRIKAAVKGNAVLKEYEVGQQIASAGPGLLWRVCRGVKRTTRKVKGVTACTCYCKHSPQSRAAWGRLVRLVHHMPIVSKFPFIMQDAKVPLDVNYLDSVFVWTSTCMNHPN